MFAVAALGSPVGLKCSARPYKVSTGSGTPRLRLLQHCRRRQVPPVTAFKDDSDEKDDALGKDAFRTKPTLPAFTRRREHTMGRVAAVGFAFSLVGELLTGIGPITQLHYETGVSHKWIYITLLAFATWGLLGGTLPGAPTYDPENLRDIGKRVYYTPLKNPRKFLLQNELLVGRLAMAGFAGACVLEYMWNGEGPLAHLGLIQPGTPLFHAPWWTIGLVGIFLANGLGLLSSLGDSRNDDDTY